jgi:hypothetical protein
MFITSSLRSFKVTHTCKSHVNCFFSDLHSRLASGPAPGSKSSLPCSKNSSSAVTPHQKAAAHTLALCLSVTMGLKDSSWQVEWVRLFRKSFGDTDDGFQKIRRTMCPFVNLPERTRGRWGLGITPAVMRTCSWVEPLLVAQIKFTEWTSDNQLRQPVFLGFRTDKDPKDVVRQ